MTLSTSPWDPAHWAVAVPDPRRAHLPFITLGVLTYNRCDDLRQTLDVLTNAVNYPSYEIIVVDNGSTDGTREMLRREFPDVVVHEVGWNMGTAARNFQTQLARGEYLFSFDDDSFPGTPSTVRRIVDFMESRPDVDVLNASCYRPSSGITETAGWQHFRYGGDASSEPQGIYLVEGGVCYRMASLKQVQGFDPAMFYNMDGPDLALQFYKRSMKIVLRQEFVNLHFPSTANRSEGLAAFWRARHPIWLIAKHWPKPCTPVLLTLWFLRRILGAILHPTIAIDSVRGLWAGLRGIAPFFRFEPKLSWRQAFALKRYYIQMFRW